MFSWLICDRDVVIKSRLSDCHMLLIITYIIITLFVNCHMVITAAVLELNILYDNVDCLHVTWQPPSVCHDMPAAEPRCTKHLH